MSSMSTSRCKTYIYLSIDWFIGFNEMIYIHIVSVCPHCPHQISILFVAMYTPYNTLDHITCHSHHQCPQQPIVHIHCLNRTYSTYCYTTFLFVLIIPCSIVSFLLFTPCPPFSDVLCSGYLLCPFWIRCMFILSHSHPVHLCVLAVYPWSPQVFLLFFL